MGAVILAGGRATRMGGVDKGLQLFDGMPLAANALRRLYRQIPAAPADIVISANRNLQQYAEMGVPICPDTIPDFAGPLAGMLSAIENNPGRWTHLLTVPCDSPYFPLDLLYRLTEALRASAADLAMVCAPDATDETPGGAQTLHNQPVFLLLKTDLAPQLADFLAQGGRKIGAWCAQHAMVRVPFDRPSDRFAFTNANTLQDLQHLIRP